MRDPWRHFASEFIGTFALVFVGGGAIVASKVVPGVGLIEVAVAHGLILALMVTALMRISGHFNPAVTAGFMVARRIDPMMAGVYVVAQILGAVVAAYALRALVPADQFAAAHGTVQEIAPSVTSAQAFGLEAIATFFLVFVVFGTAVDPQAPKVGGFAIGLTIAADILAIGPLTGGSMNPARSFGPAFVSGTYVGQIVYWAGPLVGGVVAGTLYNTLFLGHPREPAEHGAIQR